MEVSEAFRDCRCCRSWAGASDGRCTHPDAPHHDAGPVAAKWCGCYVQTDIPSGEGRRALLESARSMLSSAVENLNSASSLAATASRGDLSEAIDEYRRGTCGVIGLIGGFLDAGAKTGRG